MPSIDLSILNQRQTPAFYADTLANRPAAGFVGRIFVSTDTFAFFRDNGTGWDLIGGPGTGTVTGSGTAGQVTYWSGASTVTGDNGLFYDSVNDRLGIGTTTPGAAIDAHSTQNTILQLNQTTATNDTRIAFQNNGTSLWRIGNLYNAGANDFEIFDVVGAQQSLTVKKTTGQVLIGTTSVGSGKLVVASATGDNHIQIVGATAPSLRIDSATSGATKRAGLGISTATNNFIQGSADRDFCMFNGSTTASPIIFGIYGTINVLEAARISPARNFLIGTSSDSGYKLDVNGQARFTQSIIASAGSPIASVQVRNESTDAPFIGFYRGGTLRNTFQLLTDASFRLTDASLVANAGLTMGALSATSGDFSGSIAIANTVTAAVAAPSTHKVSILIGGVQYYLLASNI
tara:strand:- start:4422 stop:5633 length:1212 start_codon:yes stop_codon:yes gene_type:complete